MNRKLRPTKSTQQIKEEQINFLPEDVEKNLEEYKKAIKIKEKQLTDIKKNTPRGQKKLRFCCKRKHWIKKMY